MRKKILSGLLGFALVAATVPQTSAKGLESDLNKLFESMGAAGVNVTSPGAWKGQAAGYVSGGGIYVRNANNTIQLASIQLPSLNAGCGGIDAFFGAFSFLSADELIKFAKNIVSAAPGLFFDLALKTVSPQIASAKDFLQDLANEVNNMNTSSCQAARNIVGGLFPKTAANAEDICNTIGTAKGMFTDWAAGRQGCRENGKRDSANQKGKSDPAWQALVMNDVNVMWDILGKNALFKDDKELREMALTLAGTIIFNSQGHPTPYPSRVTDVDLISTLMNGDKSVSVYSCPDTACKKMTTKKFTVSKAKSFNGLVVNMIDSITQKAKNDEALTAQERAFIDSASLPVFSYIIDPLTLGLDESLAKRIVPYLAYDMLIAYLKDIVDNATSTAGKEPLNKESMDYLTKQAELARKAISDLQATQQYNQTVMMNVLEQISYMRGQISSSMTDSMKEKYRFGGQ